MGKLITAERYHDISCGHRVVGHENKCKFLHGHNYRFHFKIASASGLDEVGRVMDFGVIKSKLCNWLEVESGHYDGNENAAQELFPEILSAVPVVENKNVCHRAVSQRSENFGSRKIYSLYDLKNNQHQRRYHYYGLNGISPDYGFYTAPMGVKPD